jgi:hypothetical protein
MMVTVNLTVRVKLNENDQKNKGGVPQETPPLIDERKQNGSIGSTVTQAKHGWQVLKRLIPKIERLEEISMTKNSTAKKQPPAEVESESSVLDAVLQIPLTKAQKEQIKNDAKRLGMLPPGYCRFILTNVHERRDIYELIDSLVPVRK